MLPSGWSKAFDDKQQKFYFYHSENNVVQWNAPGLESPPSNNNSRSVSPNFTTNESLNSNRRINEFKSVNKRRGSVYDKLTDYSLYTGSSKNRFDNTGHGIPETEVVTTTATNGTKRQHRVRRQSHYSGSTNTKSDFVVALVLSTAFYVIESGDLYIDCQKGDTAPSYPWEKPSNFQTCRYCPTTANSNEAIYTKIDYSTLLQFFQRRFFSFFFSLCSTSNLSPAICISLTIRSTI